MSFSRAKPCPESQRSRTNAERFDVSLLAGRKPNHEPRSCLAEELRTAHALCNFLVTLVETLAGMKLEEGLRRGAGARLYSQTGAFFTFGMSRKNAANEAVPVKNSRSSPIYSISVFPVSW